MNNTLCIICSSGKSIHSFTKISHFDNNNYDIFKCTKCKSAFVYPVISQGYLDSFYNSSANSNGGDIDLDNIQEYLDKLYQQESLYPNTILDACRLIELARKFSHGNLLLDVGAGFGFFTKEAMNQGFTCEAIELSKTNCEIFSALNGFLPYNSCFDDDFSKNNAEKYDVIVLSQIMEHVPYPDKFVKNVRIALKKGGICIVAVPHFGSLISKIQSTRDMFVTPPEHINFFSIMGLKSLFELNEMRHLHTQTISRFDSRKLDYKLGKFYSRPITFFLKSILGISDFCKIGMYINSIYIK